MLEQEIFQEFMMTLLTMDDEQVEKEKDILFEMFEKSVTEEQVNMRVGQLRSEGKTIDDLIKENEELKKADFGKQFELSSVKSEIIKKLFDIAIDFNQKIIDKTLRKQVKVPIELMNENVEVPTYANYGDAGVDFVAYEDVVIESNTTKIVPTGIKMAIPVGYELQIRPRSGNSLKPAWQPIFVANSPGTINHETI